MKLLPLTVLLVLCTIDLKGQVINAYATVSSISGNILTLTNLDEDNDTFEDGEEIIIMQVQDDVIGSNTSNNSSFGNLNDIASAGIYEVLTISSHTESGGLPNTITVANIINTYNIGANSSVQIISYPKFGSPNYTTTQNISSKSWDGNNGGVVAFQVDGTLTIAHNINADGDGFRGASANSDSNSSGCNGETNYRVANGDNDADKGEGIYKVTDANYAAGMGKILNGGGGGSSHNGGGGGGGNFSAGGQGGAGYPNCSPSAGGLGGLDLSSQISASRIFMGGGGGSGEGNNNTVVDAGDGGGIILIKANQINTVTLITSLTLTLNFDDYPEETSWTLLNDGGTTVASGGTYGAQADGSTLDIPITGLIDDVYTFTISDAASDGLCCGFGSGSYSLTNDATNQTIASGGSFGASEATTFTVSSISANGESVSGTTGGGNDGNSGSGAGGSIVIEVNSWSVASGAPITIEANGGTGGSVNHSDAHGGGGGGGMGTVIYSITEPTTNTTTNTQPGNGGCNASSCATSASVATGTNQDGIIDTSTGPLPVELIEFNVYTGIDKEVIINWKTASEINNDYFTIERSIDGDNWSIIEIIKGAGTSSSEKNYTTYDLNPFEGGLSYYRIKQTDYDGTFSYSDIKSISLTGNKLIISLYPNPISSEKFTIETSISPQNLKFIIYNEKGQEFNLNYYIENNKVIFDINNLNNGLYIVQIIDNNRIENKKVLIQK